MSPGRPAWVRVFFSTRAGGTGKSWGSKVSPLPLSHQPGLLTAVPTVSTCCGVMLLRCEVQAVLLEYLDYLRINRRCSDFWVEFRIPGEILNMIGIH